MSYTYSYPRPSVATDICIFTINEDGEPAIVLIDRKEEPLGFAIPGGFLRENETLDMCAERELEEETGIRTDKIYHFANFSDPERDPREQDGYRLRVISVAYFALLPLNEFVLKASTDAREAKLFPLFPDSKLPKLAFKDHKNILDAGLDALRNKIVKEFLALEIMPKTFTLPELNSVYNKFRVSQFSNSANFNRHIKGSMIDKGIIRFTGEKRVGQGQMGPPTRIYSK